MSERKVLTKYYPPDFDPSKITRTPKHLRPTGPKLIQVRLMAPFSMKCTACGEYIYKGRKFNARKETTDEKYLTISIFRFYIRCTRCSGEITFKTDPKNNDYTCERGAKRNFEAWRNPESVELKETDQERLDRLQREEDEELEAEERDKMEELEQKMEESKREIAIGDALDSIRMRNARIEREEKEGGGREEGVIESVRDEAAEERERVEREIEDEARRAFAREQDGVALETAEAGASSRDTSGLNGAHSGADMKAMPPPTSFERVKKEKKSLMPGLKKKQEPSKPASLPPVNRLGLAGYGSDSGSD